MSQVNHNPPVYQKASFFREWARCPYRQKPQQRIFTNVYFDPGLPYNRSLTGQKMQNTIPCFQSPPNKQQE